MTGAASTSVSTAVAAGATSAGMRQTPWGFRSFPPFQKVVTTPPAGSLADRLATVGRAARGCSVLKPRAIGLICVDRIRAWFLEPRLLTDPKSMRWACSRATSVLPPVGINSRIDSIRQDVDMVTARINYRWGGPVIAKY